MHLSLALCLALLAVPATAHPLPGSTVTIRAGVDRIDLTVALPLHELDLAMPGGTGLGAEPAAGPVKDQDVTRLARYLSDHLAVTDADGDRIAPTLVAARIVSATDDHVGTYSRLVIDLTSPMTSDSLPMTLHYDAILHEVRSHRTAVFLQHPGTQPVGIGLLRPDPASSKPPSLAIPLRP